MPDTDVRGDITKVMAQNNFVIASLRSATPSLEEMFIKLTGENIVEEKFQEKGDE